MINKIKEYISKNINKKIRLKVNNIRNKSEYFEGKITEIYERVFIVDCKDGIKRSFNYSDILIKSVEIL